MLNAKERDEEARQEWQKAIKEIDANNLVFIDETSAVVGMCRKYGRAPTSKRLYDLYPKGKKQRASLIAGVRNNEFIAPYSFTHPESVDRAAFLTYLSKVLLPELEVGTIILMDNWSVHRGKDVEHLVRRHGCTIKYLPTYSPDFNPIEYLFSKIKSYLRKLRPTTIEALTDAFAEAVLTITPEDAHNTFRHCGYV